MISPLALSPTSDSRSPSASTVVPAAAAAATQSPHLVPHRRPDAHPPPPPPRPPSPGAQSPQLLPQRRPDVDRRRRRPPPAGLLNHREAAAGRRSAAVLAIRRPQAHTPLAAGRHAPRRRAGRPSPRGATRPPRRQPDPCLHRRKDPPQPRATRPVPWGGAPARPGQVAPAQARGGARMRCPAALVRPARIQELLQVAGPVSAAWEGLLVPDGVYARGGRTATSNNYLVRLGIGGFSMGAAAALHSAACYAHGRFTNGIACPITLSVVVGLSGWLPCSRTLRSKIETSHTATRRASALPILLNHGRADEVVTYRNGERGLQCGFP